MAKKIFDTLLQRQIDMFVATFQDDGTSLFKNQQALIHPGEYGMYRERCFCSLLKAVLTRECSLSDGFVFSSVGGHLTTQCDILVKNAFSMPLTDSEIAKFHPVEDVYAIVEMKSNLTKQQLTDTLRKLAEAKKIGDDRSTQRDYRENAPLFYDAIPTFLVCNRLMFDGFDAVDFNEIYQGIDQKYWHNAILSVEDGLFFYRCGTGDLPAGVPDAHSCAQQHGKKTTISVPCPQLSYRDNGQPGTCCCAPDFLPAKSTRKYAHIMRFLSLITLSINISVKYKFDCMEYIGS